MATEKTDAEQLSEVRIAISKLVSGARSYQIGGRQLTRVDLPDLRAWKTELEHRLARAARRGTGGFGLAKFRGAS